MKALSPIILFLATYLGGSILLKDFYALPIIIAFLIASLYSIFFLKKGSLEDRLSTFSKGAGHQNIMYMVLIFIMAGAFASFAKSIGAIDATVNMCLSVLPSSFLLPALFIAACLVSMSIGTSVGTIVALAPIASGVAAQTGASIPLYTACIVGGAFFGDNLSFISDTTIMATRTQGIAMQDKFKANFRIALPAALVTVVIYTLLGAGSQAVYEAGSVNYLLVLPYLVVLLTAVWGVNVILVLTIGILVCLLLGFTVSKLPFTEMLAAMNAGVTNMSELIVVTMLAGGLMALVQNDGGIDFLMNHLKKGIKGRRGAEASIALMTLTADFCTANNTIAILTVSDLAKQISSEYGIPAKRTASLLDTWSCIAQALIPYGAQLLIAASLVAISPAQIIPYLFYPFVLAAICFGSILFRK